MYQRKMKWQGSQRRYKMKVIRKDAADEDKMARKPDNV